MKKRSYVEQAAHEIKKWLIENQTTFFFTLLIGAITYMYMFTNKLVNHDDIHELFGKGASISSGRWGLTILEYVFPNYSMPWFYGIISLVLIAVAVCLIVRLFKINNNVLRVLLAGLIVSFPSQIGIFCYMFTSAPYALSFLLAVIAVVLFEKGTWKNISLATVLGIVSLSIYQAYIAIIASFFVVILIKYIVHEEKTIREIIKRGISQVVFLATIMGLYYVSMQIALRITGTNFNEYANENFAVDSVSVFRRVYVAYVNFMYFFTRRNWGLINTPVSNATHLVLALFTIVVVLVSRKGKKISDTLLLAVLAALLPLAINSMYLIVEEEAVHTLVLYSFISVYILVAVIGESLLTEKWLAKDLVLTAMLVVLVNNVYIANKTFLQMHIAYENAYAFYTSVVTQVKQTPGFDEEKKLAIIGESSNLVFDGTQFGDNRIQGTGSDLINIYSRDEFIKYYIGFDVPFATDEEIDLIKREDEFMDMNEYPYYGSVKVIDEYIVVKLELQADN